MFAKNRTRGNAALAARVRRRLRAKSGAGVLRLSVFKSNAHFYVQLIDDAKGVTLVSTSSVKKRADFPGKRKMNAGVVESVGKAFVEKCPTEYKDKSIVFDRGCKQYSGLLKVFADLVRGHGFKF